MTYKLTAGDAICIDGSLYRNILKISDNIVYVEWQKDSKNPDERYKWIPIDRIKLIKLYLFVKESNYTIKHLAENLNGNYVHTKSPEAIKWSSAGAALKIYHSHDFFKVFEKIRDVKGLSVVQTGQLGYKEWRDIITELNV